VYAMLAGMARAGTAAAAWGLFLALGLVGGAERRVPSARWWRGLAGTHQGSGSAFSWHHRVRRRSWEGWRGRVFQRYGAGASVSGDASGGLDS